MFGMYFRCTGCPFDFASGWSHHEGGLFLVCPSCARLYVLGRGESCWGPKDGERLQLLRHSVDDPKPIGIQVNITLAEPDPAHGYGGVWRLDFDDIPCPDCGTAPLVQSLERGRNCPACKSGTIEMSGPVIY